MTEEEIKVELRKLEQKEGLKDLDADVVSKTEEWHTFMLKAKAGKTKKQTKIQRKPTKATNEEEVSEADRQLHQKIAAEVKAKLEAKGESSEGVETFEAFYGMIKEEAAKLQKEYQPQLRDGIKIAVDLVKQDEKDGDVDFRIGIAPNNIYDDDKIKYKLPRPPAGKAYLLRQSNPRHFKAILSNGKMYHLTLVGSKEYIKIDIKNIEKEIKAEDYVEVSGVEKSGTKLKKKINKVISSYNAYMTDPDTGKQTKLHNKKYELNVRDCFSFVVDLLNGVLDKRLSPTGEDNTEKFESLK